MARAAGIRRKRRTAGDHDLDGDQPFQPRLAALIDVLLAEMLTA
jgi:hypothetical protein